MQRVLTFFTHALQLSFLFSFLTEENAPSHTYEKAIFQLTTDLLCIIMYSRKSTIFISSHLITAVVSLHLHRPVVSFHRNAQEAPTSELPSQVSQLKLK